MQQIIYDVRDVLAIHCAKRMIQLADNIEFHFKDAQIVVSPGTPRDDNFLFNERV